MDRLVTLGQLLDWYGAFLTPRRRSLATQYACEDCSLSEIAEREQISRQAVRDAIARAERELTDMEARLRLIERVQKTRALAGELSEMTDDARMREKLAALTDIWEDDDGV